MKNVFWVLVVVMLGLYGFKQFQSGKGGTLPAASATTEISNPVYADIRVKLTAGGREIEAAMFSKMIDDADCQVRAKRFKEQLESNCQGCVSQSFECKGDLAPRYLKYFDDQPAHITYLSISRGNSDQREARLIFWGLTRQEGDAVCDKMKEVFTKMKTGPSVCVRAMAS